MEEIGKPMPHLARRSIEYRAFERVLTQVKEFGFIFQICGAGM